MWFRRKFKPVKQRRWMFFGLDKEGDPAFYFMGLTFVWYKDHTIVLRGDRILLRQNPTVYRAILSGIEIQRVQVWKDFK